MFLLTKVLGIPNTSLNHLINSYFYHIISWLFLFTYYTCCSSGLWLQILGSQCLIRAKTTSNHHINLLKRQIISCGFYAWNKVMCLEHSEVLKHKPSEDIAEYHSTTFFSSTL